MRGCGHRADVRKKRVELDDGLVGWDAWEKEQPLVEERRCTESR